jgi:hypothetical protein
LLWFLSKDKMLHTMAWVQSPKKVQNTNKMSWLIKLVLNDYIWSFCVLIDILLRIYTCLAAFEPVPWCFRIFWDFGEIWNHILLTKMTHIVKNLVKMTKYTIWVANLAIKMPLFDINLVLDFFRWSDPLCMLYLTK